MNAETFKNLSAHQSQAPAVARGELSSPPAAYARPAVVDLGDTAEVIQGGSFGGYPDGYTGYRKEYW